MAIRSLILAAILFYIQQTESAPASPVCGLRPGYQTGRIVGGENAVRGQVPWQALIHEYKLFGLVSYAICGGVVIDPQWVLTAAHCTNKWRLITSYKVLMGDIRRSYLSALISSSRVTRSVDSTFMHPDFDATNLHNDIALIKLDEPVEYTRDLQPICLPTDDESFIGMDAMASGWGQVKYMNFDLPQVLQMVKVPIMDNGECERMYARAGYYQKLLPSQFCAGLQQGQKDACEGDSGGPLAVQKDDGRFVIAGIISNGINCAAPNLPGVYTNVSSFIPWILKTISEN